MPDIEDINSSLTSAKLYFLSCCESRSAIQLQIIILFWTKVETIFFVMPFNQKKRNGFWVVEWHNGPPSSPGNGSHRRLGMGDVAVAPVALKGIKKKTFWDLERQELIEVGLFRASLDMESRFLIKSIDNEAAQLQLIRGGNRFCKKNWRWKMVQTWMWPLLHKMEEQRIFKGSNKTKETLAGGCRGKASDSGT